MLARSSLRILPHRLSTTRIRLYRTLTKNDWASAHKTISTLNPRNIQSSDWLDLSFRPEFHVSFPRTHGPAARLHYHVEAPTDGWHTLHTPFPEKCTGFLYYRGEPHEAHLERSVRFRLTSTSGPSAFPVGQDLTLGSGRPWEISLPLLASRNVVNELGALRTQLLDEGFLTKDEISHCRGVFGGRGSVWYARPLLRLEDEWEWDLSSTALTLMAVGKGLHTINPGSIFGYMGGNTVFQPWTGAVQARFEPCSQHGGRRVVHIRITKIVTPIRRTSNEVPEWLVWPALPQEGELLRTPKVGRDAVWAYDIDHQTGTGAGLRDLWNAARIS
ncbi:hypothetical protein DFH06DRAFT_1190752 [Mycena polygramma]|nr:hypothetical protein DFH06DRAFT_1190752 [Mycena polygramma]